jgi:hypothetical protein
MRFLLCLSIPLVAAAARNDAPIVDVFLPPMPSGSASTTVLRAKSVATDVYAEIGIRLIWHAAAAKPAGCTQTAMHRMVVVELTQTKSLQYSDSAYAASRPYAPLGPCVTLFWDRLLENVKKSPVTAGYLLGYALAHEIGHVLEGVARHSETGVMKSSWSLAEIRDMPRQGLHFSPGDAALIRRVLAGPYTSLSVAHPDGDHPY